MSEKHFIDHHEVSEYFKLTFSILINESDRGALLLGVSELDRQLEGFFKNLVPISTSSSRKKEIFNSIGPFGNFSAKIDIAYVCRLLPENLVKALHKLRKIRNNAAHHTSSFNLIDSQKDVHEVFDLLGEDIKSFIRVTTIDAILKNAIINLKNADKSVSAEEEGSHQLFENDGSVAKFMINNNKLLDKLDKERPRWELGLGIALLSALLLFHRDKICKSLSGDEVLSKLLGKVNGS